jgi:N-acyl-D-amino-acid deacylase
MRSFVELPLLLLAVSVMSGQDFDTIIHGGRIIDGTGSPARHADIGIKDGRITKIGRTGTNAVELIDATGYVVTPGFIDVHTHAENILELPSGRNFARMGVTTLVLGNCGSFAFDVGKFLEQVESTNTAVNIATLIGHGTIRAQIMGGSFMRPPNSFESKLMKEAVQKAMDDGALGMSTGLIYLPGTFAKTDELIELAKVVSEYGGIYTSHMRSEGDDIFEALEEVFTIARAAHLPAHISHIKVGGQKNWHKADDVLAAIERARDEGLDITQDQYAYTASSTSIGSLIPERALAGGRFNEQMSDLEFKAGVVEEMKKNAADRGTDFSYAVIASYDAMPKLNGLTIAQATRRLHAVDSIDSQIEMIIEIQLNGGASGVFHSMNEDDLRVFMRHPNTMIASDSSVRTWQSGVPHPRGYGNNARVLRKYVCEDKILRLENAIQKMTSLPATTFGIHDRGVIREGAWADLVIFKPAEVTDTATYENPHQYATGFNLVMVNGVPVTVVDGPTNKKPGQVIRRNK